MAEQKDLSHFMSNPDELGNLSDEELEALADTQETSAAVADKGTDDKGDTSSAATPGDTADVQKASEDQQPDGILARDGIHVIPFSRLEAAEQKARDLAKQVDELTAKKADGTKDDKGEQSGQQSDQYLSDEELEELDRDLPALAKVIRTSQAQVKHLSEQIATINVDRQSQKQEQEDTQEKSWLEALSKNEKASYLDATLSPEAGEKFIIAAASLFPNWNTMNNEERADALVRQYEAIHGEIQVKSIALTKQTVNKPEQKHDQKADVPLSMSGIPGGAAPAVDDAADLLSKTGAELTHDFMGMTSAQIEERLNRI